MKLVKLSLAAAIAAGSFSALNAVSLEDAIKNVDFTGQLRYRYDTGAWDSESGSSVSGDRNAQSSINGDNAKQTHKFRARLAAKADIGDGFKVFGQVQYGQDANGGYGAGNTTATGNTFNLRQAYLQYDLADYGTSFIWGKQELGTIWTDDMVGMAAKALYTGIDGLTLAAFAVDSFEEDGERAFRRPTALTDNTSIDNKNRESNNGSDFIFRQNFYGAAAIGAYDLGGSTLDTQLWLGYLNKRAFFYALDVVYGLPIDQDLSWTLQVNYLGNSLDSTVKDKFGSENVANGNFVNLRGTIKGYGFDGTLGGVMYGKKGKTTINMIEDRSYKVLPAGKEIFYMKGSNLTDSFGQNTFGYVTAGYTLPSDLRLGVQFLYGATAADANGALASADLGGGDKMEAVAEVSYNYTKNLDFLLWYSYLDVKADAPAGYADDLDTKKNSVRFQAIYKF
ncbi:major outer membrane protein [Campylobacter sp. MIT 19-121]|uniref:major outer membrane protein n=1 Tax=Campylobacter sp. MIT 19-121 TaxID=2703906 RepID=UPI0013898557|nr:major outer membrane protein [Campylobacter sp. MIT 19-121]NDJ26508.1 major outer membrane protein [Campylobacter sp. MIT 19-121]